MSRTGGCVANTLRIKSSSLFAICLSLWLVPPALGQDPGQRLPMETAPIPGRGIVLGIDGRVVRAGDGSNVAGARVVLTDSRGVIRGVYYTREGGSFQFMQLGQGRYTLTVTHQDFAEHSQTLDLIFSSLTSFIIPLMKTQAPPESLQSSVAAWALRVPAEARREFDLGLEALGKQNARRAIQHTRKAIDLYPSFASAYAALGNAHQALKQNEEAIRAYEQALEIDETLFSALLDLGTLLAVSGKHQEAETHLLRARALRGDDWRVWYQLAELYWETGDAARTEENTRRARELHDAMPRIHILLINSLVGQEKYPEALAAMDAFLTKFPKSSVAREVTRKRDLLRAELARTSP